MNGNQESHLFASTVERSLEMTRKKKENSAPHIVFSNPGEQLLRRKGKNLMPAQHRAERNYQICLRIVCALRADGLLMPRELATVKRRLLKKYDSIIGTLYEETENDEKE